MVWPYSRTDAEDSMPLFDLSNQYVLSTDQQAAYRRDGHILLPQVASQAEVQYFRPIITGIADETTLRKDTQGRISDYSAMFTQVTNVWRKNPEVQSFILAKRFARLAAELMGVPAVRIYHDQALVKEPGGNPTPWHQDYYYWPLKTENTVTMWMALVDIPKEMGSMSFASGSHRNQSLVPMPISPTSQEYFERFMSEHKYPAASYELQAGDASFHSGMILHSAHANKSSRRREVITIIYYADGTRLMEPDNEHRKTDLEVFHPGQKPGELAASALNPLVYP